MITNKMQINKPYLFWLSATLSAFFFKGVIYLSIGSFVPIIVALLPIIGLYIFRNNKAKLSLITKIWAIVIMLWALARILIGSLNYFVKPLTENHLDEQLGLKGVLLSVFILGIGVYLFIKRNR